MTVENTGIHCQWCGRSKAREFSKECDFCFELRWRIDSDPETAEKILEYVKEMKRKAEE